MRPIAAGAALALLALASGDLAQAEEPAAPAADSADGIVVAADVGTAALLEDPHRSFGFGVDGRLGYTFTGLPTVTPELALGMVDFPDADSFGRAGAGARLTLGKSLQASLFAHAGAWWNDAGSGPAGDLGLAVDFALPRELFAGVHGGYNVAWVELEDGYSGVPYATMGVHLAWAPRAERPAPASASRARGHAAAR